MRNAPMLDKKSDGAISCYIGGYSYLTSLNLVTLPV